MKRVVIIGGGEIGTFIAERLGAEQFDVTVVDNNPLVLAALQNRIDVACVLANATSMQELRDAEIADADILIATTQKDETNLIACLLAGELGIPHKIAVTRYLGFRGQQQALDSMRFGINLLVNSSEAVQNEILNVIETRGASEVATFADGRITLIGYHVEASSHLVGMTVGQVAGRGDAALFHVATLVRDQRPTRPDEDTLLQKDDYLYLIVTQEHLPDLNEALHAETIKSRTAVIFGDNFLSQMLAGALLNRHFNVTMLVSTQEKATFLKEHFRERRHFHVEVGSGMELRLLRRVKVPTTSVFIASSRYDTRNITACMAAKYLGVNKTVAMVRRPDMVELCRPAGVDVHIAPRLAAAKLIQKAVHEDRLVDYKAMAQTNLEAIELEARGDCRALLKPLCELKLPEGTVVGALVSAAGPMLPDPDYALKEGDRVILLTLPQHLMEVEALFAAA
jgi:trk system potassium uptake protein TrkA